MCDENDTAHINEPEKACDFGDISRNELHRQNAPQYSLKGPTDSDSALINELTYYPQQKIHGMNLRQREPIIYSASIELQLGAEIGSAAKEHLEKYFQRFGSKEFMLHHSRGLPRYVTEHAYEKEELSFLEHVTKNHRDQVP